jgi:hypothetical protein
VSAGLIPKRLLARSGAGAVRVEYTLDAADWAAYFAYYQYWHYGRDPRFRVRALPGVAGLYLGLLAVAALLVFGALRWLLSAASPTGDASVLDGMAFGCTTALVALMLVTLVIAFIRVWFRFRTGAELFLRGARRQVSRAIRAYLSATVSHSPGAPPPCIIACLRPPGSPTGPRHGGPSGCHGMPKGGMYPYFFDTLLTVLTVAGASSQDRIPLPAHAFSGAAPLPVRLRC